MPEKKPNDAGETPTETPKEGVISGLAFVEETPSLCREARDILTRLYGLERKTRTEWVEKAKSLGGMK